MGDKEVIKATHKIHRGGVLLFILTVLMLFVFATIGINELPITGKATDVPSETNSMVSIQTLDPESLNADNIYMVETAEDLLLLSNLVNGTGYTAVTLEGIRFAQTKNIDMTGKTLVPIGAEGKAFSGIYDGKGFYINNLTVNGEQQHVGLFGYLDSATVSNIIVSGGTVASKAVTGGIAGYVAGTTINNCFYVGTFTITTGSTIDSVFGGIVGEMLSGTVKNCHSSVHYVVSDETDVATVGTVVGKKTDGILLSNTYDFNKIEPLQSKAGITLVKDGFGKMINSPTLLNGDFENSVANWKTTDSAGYLELNIASTYKVPTAPDGPNILEMMSTAGNENRNSQIYQIFDTNPGDVFRWSLYHAKRGDAGDAKQTITIRIGVPTSYNDAGSYTVRKKELNTITTANKSSNHVEVKATTTVDWAKYEGTYTVPVGQTQTFFVLENTNMVKPGLGNIIDGVKFAIADPIYLSGTGNDAKQGDLVANAVKTFNRARELVKEGGTIEVVGTVTVTDEQVWSLAGMNATLRRSSALVGTSQPMVMVSGSGSLTLAGVKIDGGAVWKDNANSGIKPKEAIIVAKDTANVYLNTGTVLQNNSERAITGSGNVEITLDGATIQDCKSSGLGGGITLSDSAKLTVKGNSFIRGNTGTSGGGILARPTNQVILEGGTLENNSANVGSAMAIFGDLTINPNAVTISNDIFWASSNPIILSEAPSEGANTYTINYSAPAIKKLCVEMARAIDGVSGKDNLKPLFKVANAGWTFGYHESVDDEMLEGKLYLVSTIVPVATTDITSTVVSPTSIQKVIDDIPDGGSATVYILTENGDDTLEIYETITVGKNKTVTFKSGKVTVPNTDDGDYLYELSATPNIVKRGINFTGSMLIVEKGATVNVENITFDGGAKWGVDGAEDITIDSVEDKYFAKTNNKGIKAHAPVITVLGNAKISSGATIANNENSFSSFGSENYGGAVRVSGVGATFTMEDGAKISKCYAREGGAIMNVTKFSNKTGSTDGSTAIITGGTIEGCMSQSKGSAIQTIYGNAVTEITGGTISGDNPSESDYGVLTVEEGGKLIISGGTISNTDNSKKTVYAYNDYCNNYGGYLEGNHAAQLVIKGGNIGKIGLDASGIAKTTSTDNQTFTGSKQFDMYIDNADATENTQTYSVELFKNWTTLGAIIVKGNIGTYTVTGFADNNFVYPLANNLVVGGMELTDATVGNDGKVTVNGKILGIEENLSITVGGGATTITLNGEAFSAVTTNIVAAGTKDIVLTYQIGNRTLTSKMRITVPVKTLTGEFTGNVDYGTLEQGEKLMYLGADGQYHNYDGTQLPNDIVIDENGYATFKLVEADGKEFVYKAFVGKRDSKVEPSDEVFSIGNITKNDTTLTIDTKAGYEYCLLDKNGDVVKLDSKDWNEGTATNSKLTFLGLNPGENYTVTARKKGTADTQAGIIKSVDVTTNTTIEQNKIDAKVEIDIFATEAKAEIDKLKNLSAKEKADAKAEIEKAVIAAKTAVDNAADENGIDKAIVDGKKACDDLVLAAQKLADKNLADIKAEAERKFDEFISNNCPKVNYSTEDYTALEAKIAQAKAKLAAETDATECEKWLTDALTDVKSVKTKAPTYALDKENDCLTQLSQGDYNVTVDGATYEFNIGADGKLALQGKDKNGKDYDFANKTISLVKKGAEGFADSNAATETLPERVVKPEKIPVGSIVAGKTEITVKGDAVVSNNKYAVVDLDGNIVAEGWVVGENGKDIVFGGLESGKSYNVVMIGKNTSEPSKLPSNPSDGTTITTTSNKVQDEVQKNFVWVVLCSIFGVLLVAEVIFLLLKRNKKKDNKNNDNNADNKNNKNDVKLKSSIIPVLAVLGATVVAPVAGPIIFTIIIAAMVAVPVVLHFIDKDKPNAEQPMEEAALDQSANQPESIAQETCTQPKPKADVTIVTIVNVTENKQPSLVEVIETERLNAETESTEKEQSIIVVLEKSKQTEKKAKTPDEIRLQALDILIIEYHEKEEAEERRQKLLAEIKTQAETKSTDSGKSVKETLLLMKSEEKDAEKIEILTLLIIEAEQEEHDIAAYANAKETEEVNTTVQEIEAEKEKAAEARLAFIQAKKSGIVALPVFSFKISREDVLDYVAVCADNHEKFPEKIDVKTRKKPSLPDSFYCGVWCYGLLYEKRDVIKLVLRLSKKDAEKIANEHTGFEIAKFPGGENWYNCVIDSSYTTKKEVYDIIDLAYAFVLNKYFKLENGSYVTDLEAAKKDSDKTVKDVANNEKTVDPMFDSAIAEFVESKQAYEAKHKLSFEISRRRITNYVKRTQPEKCDVVQREKWYLPASLKVVDKTYAMVYEKNSAVSLTVRLAESYAETLAQLHPQLCRARFPRGNNWYVLPIDGSFYSVQSVYTVLADSRKFIEEATNTTKPKSKK